jgi:hypothetical protein
LAPVSDGKLIVPDILADQRLGRTGIFVPMPFNQRQLPPE